MKSASKSAPVGSICARVSAAGRRCVATAHRINTRASTRGPVAIPSSRQPNPANAGCTAIPTRRWRDTSARSAAAAGQRVSPVADRRCVSARNSASRGSACASSRTPRSANCGMRLWQETVARSRHSAPPRRTPPRRRRRCSGDCQRGPSGPSGEVTATFVPRPGVLLISSTPPILTTRSRMPNKPEPSCDSPVAKPQPSSSSSSRTS